MLLKPAPQAEWDRERGVMYRPGVADEEVFKIGIVGVRIEMRSSNIDDLFVEHSLGQVQVEIRGSQPLFAIGTCSKAQMDRILAKFGPGKSPFTYKNIRMYLRRWESTPPGRGIPGRLDRRRANIPSRTAGDDGGQIEPTTQSHGWISERYLEDRLDRMISSRTQTMERRLDRLDRQQQATQQQLGELTDTWQSTVTALGGRIEHQFQALADKFHNFGGGGEAHQ
ncbi:hypothetical protein DVH05_001417 [Phytophthora capsici]|nr:hypothetical protein DVH05_001417 [Phytophthora capsici]